MPLIFSDVAADAKEYCTANPAKILPTHDNCAQYFNCSVFGSSPSDYVKECVYPDLFSSLSFTCQDFTTVNCTGKTEPQAPCKQSACVSECFSVLLVIIYIDDLT